MNRVIEIDNLNFSYDNNIALKDINLKIHNKDFLAIIGPNGGGKSTLVKLLVGILKLPKNSIRFNGKPLDKQFNKIGYVPQNTNINTKFPIKVIEVVMMGGFRDKKSIKKGIFSFLKDNSKDKELAIKSLSLVGIDSLKDKKIGDLSGGQIQKVMIARALYGNPSILILDEPTASIDAVGQKQVYDVLKKLNKTMTIIVVSHDISVILGYANKVAYLNNTLIFHNIEKHKNIRSSNEHFCEVEMLELLGKCVC